jgi:flagellar basal body-associated protein FliL
MLKQSFSKAKKVLTILLAVLFVVSLTVGAASACHSHGHHHSCDSCSSSDGICESYCAIPVATVSAAMESLVTNVAVAAKPYVNANS